jgi:hypothetical protein
LTKQDKIYEEVTQKKQAISTYVYDGCFIHQNALDEIHFFRLTGLLSNFSVSIDVYAKFFFCLLDERIHITI